MKKFYAALFLVLSLNTLKAQCPVIRGAFINSCSPGPNNEGLNELVLFTTTAQAAVSNYVLSYGAGNPPADNAPTGILSGANATAKNGTGIITAIGGCNIIYVSSPATVIPIGANVVFIPSNFTNNFDVSTFCQLGGVAYVVFIDITAAPSTWIAGGTLANDPGVGVFRYFQVSNGASTCAIGVRAYTSGWGASVDGNFVAWDLVGTATYSNLGCDLITVPVKLLSFSAVGAGKNANIAWLTASETNSKFFELQRSGNGSNFSSIATVAAAGHSSETKKYNFTDADIPSGANYYRLKMTDMDGTVTYSQIVKVISTRNNFVITNAYPKPALAQLSVTWNAPAGGKTTANIYDLTGRMLMSQSLATATGMNYAQLQVSQLPKGQYLLKLMKDGEIVVTQFSKQ
jgi:hypothetical protein